jgi:hypothetical protein
MGGSLPLPCGAMGSAVSATSSAPIRNKPTRWGFCP